MRRHVYLLGVVGFIILSFVCLFIPSETTYVEPTRLGPMILDSVCGTPITSLWSDDQSSASGRRTNHPEIAFSHDFGTSCRRSARNSSLLGLELLIAAGSLLYCRRRFHISSIRLPEVGNQISEVGNQISRGIHRKLRVGTALLVLVLGGLMASNSTIGKPLFPWDNPQHKRSTLRTLATQFPIPQGYQASLISQLGHYCAFFEIECDVPAQAVIAFVLTEPTATIGADKSCELLKISMTKYSKTIGIPDAHIIEYPGCTLYVTDENYLFSLFRDPSDPAHQVLIIL